MPFIGKQPKVGAYQLIDSITTSATATYALTVDGSAYFPASARNLIVSLNGVTQAPESAYTVSGSNIVFDSALTASDVIDYIMVIGDAVDIGTPSDGTVGNAQLKSDLDFSGKTLTFSNDQISGDAISGGTATLDGLTVDTDTLYVDSTNNRVGIGTTTTSEALTVAGSGTTARISLTDTDSVRASMTGLMEFDGTDDRAGFVGYDAGDMSLYAAVGDIKLSTSGAARLTIKETTGNVGINNENPQSPLEINNVGTSDPLTLELGGQRNFSAATYGATAIVATSNGTRGDHDFGAIRFEQNPATGDGHGALCRLFAGGESSSFASKNEFLRGTAVTTGVGVDNVTIRTNDTERMRIDSSGNLQVTGTLGNATLEGNGAVLEFSRNGANYIGARGGSSSFFIFQTGGATERMRLDTSGNLLVGKTSPDLATAGGEIRANGQIGAVVASTPFFANRTAGDGALIDFYVNNTYVGKIQHTSGTVAIAQASDERLKQNVVEISGCLEEIKQIRPVSWDWNSRDGGSIGVVAQEIQQIWPDVVDEGEDGYLTVAGISRVEARLIKAIQEQQTIIEDLQTRLSALEAN